MAEATAKKTAGDIMTSEPVCVDPATTVRELARIFDEYEISGAPVTDGGGRVIGIVSQTDVIRACVERAPEHAPAFFFEMLNEDAGEDMEYGDEEDSLTVEDFMTMDPITVAVDEPLAGIAKRLADEGVHRVIVVDKDDMVQGVITSLDLLRCWPA